MKNITNLCLFILIMCVSNFGFAQTEGPGYPDFPGTGNGPVFTLSDSTNVFSGTITTPTDVQDRFQIQLLNGQSITSINTFITQNPGYNPIGFFSVNGSSISFPGGDIPSPPSSPGTYPVIVAADFSVGEYWVITVNVTSVDPIDPTDYFITTWKTDNPGTSTATSITIPTHPDETYSFEVSWENDGSWETGFTGDASHDYGTAGTYTVAIRGDFPRIYFNDSGDKEKIISIEQWGTNVWSSMGSAFFGCNNLIGNAPDTPNLSEVTDMSSMFADAYAFNQDIGNWDVGDVTDMIYMFGNASVFNQDIGNWDVGNVINMASMFGDASAFNQDIGDWDVGSVTAMYQMFDSATVFNQDIGDWNVGNVTNMEYMFNDASTFNQDLGNWDVSNVTRMERMFSFAFNFDQNIGNWNVSNVTEMDGMFYYAYSFNQDIGNWNVRNVTDMSYMFGNASVFNQDIGNWNVGNVTNMKGMFGHDNAFNQDIGNWDVANVTDMSNMFFYASDFNQHIGSWNVTNVTDMNGMFNSAYAFNHNISNWNVAM